MLNTTTPTRRHAHGLALGLTAFVFAACPVAAAEPSPHDNASKVSRFTYSRTLEAQERELRADPLLWRMNESRRRLAADPHRPAYHYVNPEGNLNDPNGLCFWRGRWHLFYQAYPPEDPRQHWGHAVSDDLIHWRDLPLAIYPSPEQACFSGSCLVEDDRVIAIYHGTELGTMVAVADDPLLLNWKKITGRAVIPIAKPGDPPLPYNVFDPCIWKKAPQQNLWVQTACSHGLCPEVVKVCTSLAVPICRCVCRIASVVLVGSEPAAASLKRLAT